MIRITGRDDTVIYEGEGEVVVGLDGALNGVPAGVVVLRMADGDFMAQLEITGLLQSTPHTWTQHYEDVPVFLEQDTDPARLPDPPRIIRTVLDIDIEPETALQLQQMIDRGYRRDSRRYRRLRDSLMEETAQRLYESGSLPPEDVRALAGFEELEAEIRRRAPAGDLSIRLAEQEALIKSTRDQFPHDPYDYGRIHPKGPSRWTPPPEGEEVPPCPA